jgi:hypothetical protein
MSTYKIHGEIIEADSKEQALAMYNGTYQAPEIERPLDDSWEFSPMEMISNIPRSGGQFIEGQLDTFKHPVDTVTNMLGLIGGAIAKLIPNEQPQERYVDAVWDALVERYGSPEKAAYTLEQDPVAPVADVLAVITGGKGLARAGGKANLMMNPDLPTDLMKSSTKFSTRKSLPEEQRTRMAETMLENRIMPTSQGLDKISDLQSSLGSKIDSIIDTAANRGTTVDFGVVSKYVKDYKDKLRKSVSPDADADIAAVDKYMNQWYKKLIQEGRTQITVPELQELKRSMYQRVDYDRTGNKAEPALDQTRKNIARGAREGIEVDYPEIKPLNERMGRLMELEEELPQSVKRIENRDVGGIGAPIRTMKGAVVGEATGIPLLGATLAAKNAIEAHLDRPLQKARRAQRLYDLKTGKKGVTLPLTLSGALTAEQINEIMSELMSTDFPEEDNQSNAK